MLIDVGEFNCSGAFWLCVCVCVVYTGLWWLDREYGDSDSETSLTNAVFFVLYWSISAH